jgi:hypothetical protein
MPAIPGRVTTAVAAMVAAVLWATRGGEGCGISTHTEIGHRALHLLSTHPSPAADLLRSTQWESHIHCKKWFVVFPSPAGMSLTTYGDEKTVNLFLQYRIDRLNSSYFKGGLLKYNQ